ncbi:MAG: C cytochrome precursor [Planctomycetia bacterium]|nr:C cytochrome precursor [Planctomycetia bacterium]
MLEVLLLIVAAILALLPLLVRARRGRVRRALAAVIALMGVAAATRGVAWMAGTFARDEDLTLVKESTPYQVEDDGYAGSESCRACHPGQHKSWHRSFHRTMTQWATPEAVIGDFDDVTLEKNGVEYELERRGDAFLATATGLATGGVEMPIVMTTGSHHYQLYWTPGGKENLLHPFPFVYLKDEGRWATRESVLIMPPHGQQGNVFWNEVCIRCHSVHSQPRWDDIRKQAATRTAELGIACEACHGPGKDHIAAHRSPLERQQWEGDDRPDPTIVLPTRLTAERSSQVCGQCHAIATFENRDYFHGHWNRFRPGQDLHDVFNVVLPTKPETLVHFRPFMERDENFLEGRFWKDGMARVSGREYNALVESPCYKGGKLSCLSCHSMHDYVDKDDQLGRGMNGDRACLQCHERMGDDIQSHTHHAPQSAGSRCYNCHMPHTSYGLLKSIRTHQIHVPTVRASVETGRPHACNICHADKSLGWTQERLHEWYGTEEIELSPDQKEVSQVVLHALSGDPAQRGLAAWGLGWDEARKASGEQWMVPHLALLFDDPYPAVRYIARRSLRRIPGYEKVDFNFIGPQEQRRAGQDMALSIFKQKADAKQGDRTGSSVLLDASGQLDFERFGRLIEKRNQRDLDIQE